MLILAFDSSTGVVTTAVACSGESGREVLAEISIPSRGASETLLPAVHAALDLAGTDLSEVERILVGVGPGTFTGIRIALAAARALSLATGAALSRNSTLAALAAPTLLGAAEPEVLAVLDARRRQVFAQRFGDDGARGEISCSAPEELPAMLTAESVLAEERTLIVGDGAVRYRETLSGLGHVPPDASPLHRVTAVGHVLSADLTPVPAREVVPLYVREPDAEARRDLNPWSKA
ncbi:MAG: tRNA (adenosine(37)-N6)-threonylcarbamoyltransferase complex dimerization subunit type 1 TsaB [Actinomycetota bacterium]|nr:tRNA (adenosine(37)-N6)-threonylcarbamoyltransferase complex dimerization subunit type 1 TsaB [Actinomycetota bacterium]